MNNDKIVLPKDLVIASEVKEGAKSKIVPSDKIPKKWAGVDVGPETIDEFKKHLKKARTVFWNGPMGVYEIEEFSKGSFDVARFLAGLKADVIAGGGDSSAVIDGLNLRSEFTHVSTGGGSSLELLEKGTLPGLEVLKN